MKILMIPSRMLPIPPVKGGAVQNLINFYIEWNEKEKNNDLIVTSIYNEDAVKFITKKIPTEVEILNGAGDGTRTRNSLLGRQAL